MTYIKDGIEYPRCTTILAEFSDGPPLQWAANCAVEWIKDNTNEYTPLLVPCLIHHKTAWLVDEEDLENLHPPMYHIIRFKIYLTQKEDAKCYQFFIPTRNTLDSSTNIYKASRFPKLMMMCLIS